MDNTEPKSDTPQLTIIAATILTGLLASGDYTDGPETFTPYEERAKRRAKYRPEAIPDAIELTAQLVAQTKKQFEIHGSSDHGSAA